jgi:hypothetical protein
MASYVGSSATINICDTCDGLRQHIKSGLRSKGYETREYYLGSPSETGCTEDPFRCSPSWNLPPQKLFDVLLEQFFERLHDCFPIVQYAEVQRECHRALADGKIAPGFAPLLFALLAVSTPFLGDGHEVFLDPECRAYNQPNLGEYFYALAWNALNEGETHTVKLGVVELPVLHEDNSIHKVMAWGLISKYLACSGNEAEAWVSLTGSFCPFQLRRLANE